jgi:hypothetical protein
MVPSGGIPRLYHIRADSGRVPANFSPSGYNCASSIAVAAVICGLAVEQVYGALGLSAQAMVGQATEIIPGWAGLCGAVILLLFSVKPVTRSIMKRFHIRPEHDHESHIHPTPLGETCATASPVESP